MRRALAAATMVASLLWPGEAPAIQDEIQVYVDDVNAPGEYGLETHINTTPRGRRS